MPEIKSFHAIYYNQEKIKDLSKVVCPPYDVISEKQQDAYYKADPHNFIRILLGKEKPSDNPQENKYTRARESFDAWLKEGIFIRDEKPCIYYYKQEYRIVGEKYSRLGFISLMKVEDEKKSKIFPHENTHSRAKEDRFKLWGLLSANLSSIFVCFSDKGKKVEKIFAREVAQTRPVADVVDDEGVRHIIWRLDHPDSIQEIVDALADQHLFIADGHHRYEVARELRDERKAKLAAKPTGKEPFNYVMTYFTDMESRDLKILPIHRIIKKLSGDLGFLEEFFRIDRVKTKEELSVLLVKAGRNEYTFGLYTKDGMVLLRLKNKLLIDKYVENGSSEYRRLDAMILKSFVLDRLGVRSEDIIYTKDINEAINKVDNGEAEASFIMNPVKIQHLRAIALNGERMPPKTTYFYPKVLSGLTIYKME